MRAKLTGTVEADETYVGGKGTGTSGGPMAGGSEIAVFPLVSRDGEARSTVVDDVKAKTLKGIIRDEVEGTAHICTDQMMSNHGMNKEFASHGTVDHAAGEYVRGVIHVNFSESYFSLFKRGIIGAFHHISRKHIQRYLEEFDFRWTWRKITDAERMLAAVAGADGSACSTAHHPGSGRRLSSPAGRPGATPRARATRLTGDGPMVDETQEEEEATAPEEEARPSRRGRKVVKPTSLYPLTFEEVIDRLLGNSPPAEKPPGEEES